MSMEILDRARALKQQASGKMRTVEIADLGEDNGPLTVHVKPITNEELRRIISEPDRIKRAALTIDIRALDENGKRMFANEATEIIRAFMPKYLLNASEEINRDINEEFGAGGLAVTVENVEAAKNS